MENNKEFEDFKKECERLIFDIHGVGKDFLEADEDDLLLRFTEGEKPIDIALAFDPNYDPYN